MLWVVLVTTVVTILRFTDTPTTAVVCFRWFYFVVVLYISLSTVLLIVPVTASVVRGGTSTWVNPSSKLSMPWFGSFNRSLVGGVQYITYNPSF
jgi:hypothetical protein